MSNADTGDYDDQESMDLHRACRMGDLGTIQQAYRVQPEKINQKDPMLGWSPLYRTVVCGHLDATEFLLSQGADPNLRNELGETPLHHAASNCQLTIATLLLKYSSDPNTPQLSGDTPLHLCTRNCDLEMMDLLLTHGSDVNHTNTELRQTPLHLAVLSDTLECVQRLLKAGADVSIPDIHNRKPIDYARSETVKTAILTQFSQLKHKTCPLYTWLNRANLSCLYDILIESGYDDLEELINQMKSPLPISDASLRSIGISKPGYRARLLMKLEEECGIRSAGKRRENRGNDGKWCGKKQRNVEEMSLVEVLTEMRLELLYEDFVASGYDDYPSLLSQLSWPPKPITDHLLATEIHILSSSQRSKVLHRLHEDASHFGISLDSNSRNNSCQPCFLM